MLTTSAPTEATNRGQIIETTTMTGSRVIAAYHDPWLVKQSFPMLKTDLAARPIFYHARHAIEAHLTIVFAVLTISRHIYVALAWPPMLV